MGVVDEVAVKRRCAGDRTVPLTSEETFEAFCRLTMCCMSAAEIAERLGVSERAVVRWRAGVRPKSLVGAA